MLSGLPLLLLMMTWKEMMVVNIALTRIILSVDISILDDSATIGAFDKDGW